MRVPRAELEVSEKRAKKASMRAEAEMVLER